MDDTALPLPQVRCLTKEEASRYLGIGLTLLAELNIPSIKLGRRLVYDVVDLDAWLDEYKRCGRAGKETLWPVKQVSTAVPILGTGGYAPPSPTAKQYAIALGLKSEKKPKLY